MNALQRQARAAVDLGLLTRVLCHELNNLVANQRGYARLLKQHGAGGAGQRWLGELAGAADALQGLVASVQQWTRRAARDVPAADTRPAWLWPPGEDVAGLAADLAARGSVLTELGLCRVLAIVADHAGAGAGEWRPAPAASAPPDGGVLGVGERARLQLGLRLPDRSSGQSARLWAQSAEHILPAGEADDNAWLRALVLGLLRQHNAELFHARGVPDHVELWLPVMETTLDSS